MNVSMCIAGSNEINEGDEVVRVRVKSKREYATQGEIRSE